MSDHDVEVGGGGTIAVDTGEMLRAATLLADAQDVLLGVARRAAVAAAGTSNGVRIPLDEAHGTLLAAARESEAAAAGLRTAAQRYGWAEHAAAQALQTWFAAHASFDGAALRTGGTVGAVIAYTDGFALPAVLLTARTAQQWLATGRFAPQSDPVVIAWLQLTLSSLDDFARGWLLVETPHELVHDDPAAPIGLQAIAAAASAVLWPGPRRPVDVHRISTAPVHRPASVAELAERQAHGLPGDTRVRVERYRDADGSRWIVYSAGTVTFDVHSGDEPFDLESDVRGVADQHTDAQEAVLEAMRQAGVGPDDPVLLVGHSQGALNAMRVAQHGGYRVEGVVQFGGPTTNVPAPPGTDVLAFQHPQDVVPVLSGLPVASAGTVVVRRWLPDGGRLPGPPEQGAVQDFPGHSMRNYVPTAQQAESLADPRQAAIERRWAGFFRGGDGEAMRYGARRGPAAEAVPQRVSAPAPSPRADAAPDRPASR